MWDKIKTYGIPLGVGIIFLVLGLLLQAVINTAIVFLSFVLATSVISYFWGTKSSFIFIGIMALVMILMPPISTLTYMEFIFRYFTSIVVASSITFIQHKLKSAKMEIQFAQERLSYISASMDDVVVSINPKGEIVYLSDSVTNMFGYTKQELIGQEIFLLFPDEVRDEYRQELLNYKNDAVNRENRPKQQSIAIRKDKTTFPIEVAVWEFEDKTQSSFTLILSDITFRIEAENLIKSQKERLEIVAKSINDSLITIDEDAVITFCNPSVESMFGWKDTELIGQSLTVLMPERLKEAHRIGFGRYLKTKERALNWQAVQLIGLKKNNEEFPIEMSFGEYVYQDKVAFTAVVRDITFRENLLQEAKKAKEVAELANYEKDRFLANLSHELRTPLVSILGYSSMLLEDDGLDAEEREDMVKVIYKNAKLQVDLIEDLLDLSRIIANKIELKKSFFNIKEVLDHSVAMLQQQIDGKQLKIYKDYESYTFYGDKKRIQQIVLNLLSNAVKFTDSGYIRIGNKVEDNKVKICIKDSGIGIASENLPNLFKEFGQVDKSATRNKGGLGLGLSIVKNLVLLHEGEVCVESKLGCGSKFSVSLPVLKEPTIEEKIEEKNLEASFEGIKILLVEDEVDSADFLKFFYERQGATVDWASGASKAREFIEKSKYNIYVFDLAMPIEDGISLITSLRALDDNTPAVALTAFVDTYYEKKALDAGFDKFLKKPSSFPDLLSVIELLGKKQD